MRGVSPRGNHVAIFLRPATGFGGVKDILDEAKRPSINDGSASLPTLLIAEAAFSAAASSMSATATRTTSSASDRPTAPPNPPSPPKTGTVLPFSSKFTENLQISDQLSLAVC